MWKLENTKQLHCLSHYLVRYIFILNKHFLLYMRIPNASHGVRLTTQQRYTDSSKKVSSVCIHQMPWLNECNCGCQNFPLMTWLWPHLVSLIRDHTETYWHLTAVFEITWKWNILHTFHHILNVIQQNFDYPKPNQ
jgi:hypothetical protein